MKLIIGSDHIGLALKETIKEHLAAQGCSCDDIGVFTPDQVDYPDIALALAQDIAAGAHDRGILICGTGIGMAIVANKVPGIRAAQVHDIYTAERARKSNNAQIMTLGAQVLGVESAKLLVDVWLRSEYSGGRSVPKVEKIAAVDAQYRRSG